MNVRRSALMVARAMGIVVSTAAAWCAPGCHTTEGIGEDIEELGEGIDDAAEDARDDPE